MSELSNTPVPSQKAKSQNRESGQKIEDSGQAIRRLAMAVLLRFERNRKSEQRLKADALIAEQIQSASLEVSAVDRRFLQALVLGALRQQVRLDAWIEALSGRPLKQLEPVVKVLLRLGLFQLGDLDQVPAYAAIDTTVRLARQQTRNARTVKFVNAVLREAQRQCEADNLPDKQETDPIRRFLWRFAWPEAWTRLLLQSYSLEQVEAMAQASQKSPTLSIRINTLKITLEAYRNALIEAGIDSKSLPNGPLEGLLLASWPGSIRELPGYAEGWFYVQDAASMWVARLVNPQPGERILDMCAAPGSKTSHMAALAQNRVRITALDPAMRRVALLHENIMRLGLENIEVIQTDALDYLLPLESISEGYDKILVDAPCSGSGTVRRHPEILQHLAPPQNLEALATQQLALLEKALTCLKSGGLLIYSTCSILPQENCEVIQMLQQRHPSLTLIFEEQRLIQPHSDGFYAAILLK